MKNPRNLFILVGFLAQSLTWEGFGFAIVSTLLWALGVTLWHHKVKVRLSTEALALVLGCVTSIVVSKALHRSPHFFIGDGLVALQLIRLIRPLTRREKLTSVVIACFHLGVLCTLAPDLVFVLLFLAGLYLLPGALKDAFHEREATPHTSRVPEKLSIQFVPTMRVCLWLLLGSVFVFLTFPRFTGTPLQLRDGLADQGSLLDTILDPRRGGKANSAEVLMQIDGVDVGYLRCFSLTEFDGVQWSTPLKAPLQKPTWVARTNLLHKSRYLYRKVFVKNAHYLGRFIPLDGWPRRIEQNFFSDPWLNPINEAFETTSIQTMGENVYEFFVDTRATPLRLNPRLREHLLYVPPQSERLTNWLAQVTHAGTNALEKARLLERYFHQHFRYEIGTPELSRLAPIDDFIFNRQAGHCERFAAAMALLLRLQGVPSRIAIGYVPTSVNMFSGRAQVRFRDAHSWTEGYFDGVGWVQLDGTPGPPPSSRTSDLLGLLDDLEFAWYSHVVNFNGFAQRDLAASTLHLLRGMPRPVWIVIRVALGLALVCLIAIRFGWRPPKRWPNLRLRKRSSGSHRAARHYYEEFVQLLRKRGIERADAQTPHEFLEELREKTQSGYDEASVVTANFCRSFYGTKELTADEQNETHAALKRLKQPAAHHADHHS